MLRGLHLCQSLLSQKARPIAFYGLEKECSKSNADGPPVTQRYVGLCNVTIFLHTYVAITNTAPSPSARVFSYSALYVYVIRHIFYFRRACRSSLKFTLSGIGLVQKSHLQKSLSFGGSSNTLNELAEPDCGANPSPSGRRPALRKSLVFKPAWSMNNSTYSTPSFSTKLKGWVHKTLLNGKGKDLNT